MTDAISINDLTESSQKYLEVIHDLEATEKVARAKDIAERLGVQRGSVTGALKGLEEKGLIHYRPYSYIRLTAAGRRIAREIAHRHAVLKDFLLNVLQVDPQTAERTACRMEHVIDRKTVERLVCFIEYIFTCPRAGKQWLDAFIRHCTAQRKDPGRCVSCIDDLKALD